MIGLDTNVLVRYVVRDDPGQTALADDVVDGLVPEEPAFVPLVVVIECWSVLGRAYGYPSRRREEFVEGLLASQELRVEGAEILRGALRRTREGADLADAVIAVVAGNAGCDVVLTFDRGAARHAGMRLLGP